jgi:hypothetical protein
MQLRTGVGVIKLEVLHGQDPSDRHWGCPVREHWGLTCHQQLSLALEDKLAFTVTATATYEQAAAVAGKWGVTVDDSTLHALTQRLGTRAEARTQAALKTSPPERQPERAPTQLAVLMLDGWQVRQRGPGWGKKKTQQPRVEWHEWKTGVYYRHEQAGVTAGGRGVLAEKIVIGWQGDPVALGRRLHWEALRGGLGRAQARLVAGDGAPWIWNVAQDRWAGCLRSGGVGLSAKAMSVQTARTILDAHRHAPSQRPERGPPQLPLGRTVAHRLIGGSVKMRPLGREGAVN